MAVEKGLERWTCDRCGKAVVTDGGDVEDWRTVRHIDSNDVILTRLVCPECYVKFKGCASYRDKAFDDYMNRRDEG